MTRGAQDFQIFRAFIPNVSVRLVMYGQFLIRLAAPLAFVPRTIQCLLSFLLPRGAPKIADIFGIAGNTVFGRPPFFHVQGGMSRLIGDQSQVIDRVVRPVTIYVVNYFGRVKIAPDMLLHDIAMLQDVFESAATETISRMRVIVGRDYQDVAVLPGFSAAFPSGGKFFAFAEHRVVCAFPSFAEHRIFITCYIPFVGRVGIGKITGCRCATPGAIGLIGFRGPAPKLRTALGTRHKRPLAFKVTGASVATKAQTDAGVGLVGLFTVLASSFYHALNCTPIGALVQL